MILSLFLYTALVFCTGLMAGVMLAIRLDRI